MDEPRFVEVKRKSIDRLRPRVFKRDNYQCRYCGSKEPPFHADHVYPVALGGQTTMENLVTACEDCNQKKNAKVGIWPKPIGYFEDMQLVKVEKVSVALPIFIFMFLCNVGYFVVMMPDIRKLINGENAYVSPILTLVLISLLVKSASELIKSIIAKENKNE